jgi:hypothetical protein
MIRTWQAVIVAGAMLVSGGAFAQGKGDGSGKGDSKGKGDGKGPGEHKGGGDKAAAADKAGKGAAGAEAAPADAAAMFPKAGAETKALAPFVGMLKLKGSIAPGGMGPGSPAMETKGTHNCKWTMNGLWLDCDVKDGPVDGKMPGWVGAGTSA